MIAKLCTHAPTRIEAIDAMSQALDSFVVDGIGHNIPFLTALMRHPRWRNGNFSTAFIAEEYPDGFKQILPDSDQNKILAAVALAVELLRKDRLDGHAERVRPHSGKLKSGWVVRVGDERVSVSVLSGQANGALDLNVSIGNGDPVRILSNWAPGDAVWSGTIGGARINAQIRTVLNGVSIAWQGLSVVARVMSPRIAELDALMPVKLPPDNSKLLLCPMPGVVVSLAVEEGQEVKAGDTLAIIEAMKMENVLRAERDLVVSRINAKQGDSLAVDAVIMEFSA
jgi:propionyl-CoA carboxylase alpha chain